VNQEHTEKWIIVLPLLILASFSIAYLPAFEKLLKQWSAGDNSYCYLIVPLFVYLLYDMSIGQGRRTMEEGRGKREESEKQKIRRAEGENEAKIRDQRSEVGSQRSSIFHRPSEAVFPLPSEAVGSFRFGEFTWSLWGMVPIVFSVVLIIVGELGSVRALMFVGIWGSVVGLCVMLYGKRARQLAFPLFILFFIVPLPPFVNQVLTFKLKMAASKLSVLMLRAVGVVVLLEGNIIDVGVEKLQVADACSGLRYFMPMILMAVLVAYFFVKGRWRWTVLLLLIVPLSIFINAVRIWMSALFVVNGHPELAHNLFHDFSGWLMFMIAGAILVAVALILRRISHRPTQTHTDLLSERPARTKTVIASRKKHNPNDLNHLNEHNDLNEPNYLTNKTNKTNKTNTTNETNWPKPILITIALCLLFAVSGWALKEIPSSSHLPRRMSFEHFPMQIGNWHGKREYISQNILNSLWADDYVTAQYFKNGTPNMIYLLIPYYNYQVTNHAAHAPQACILGSGFSLVRSKEHRVPVGAGKNIKIMTMVLEKGDTRMLGSYFFLQKGRVIISPWMNKFYLIWNGIFKQRTDGALVRAEMTVAPGQTMDAAYAELEGFIAKLWPILSDYVPN